MLAQKRLQRDLENLQGDLKKFIVDAKAIGIDEINQSVEGATDKSSEQIRQFIKQSEESLAQIREQIRETSKKVETTIEEHPYAAVGAAVGVGFLLGKLLNLGKSSAT